MVVEWAQAATITATLTAVMGVIVGLQRFWIARSLDGIEQLLDRFGTRFDRIEGREPPSLRGA